MKAKATSKPRRKLLITKRTNRAPSFSASKTKASQPAPGPPKRILVPVDFSLHSNQALQYARSFATQFNARIILIHVVEAFPIDYLLGLKSAKAVNEWLLEQSRNRLRQVARQFAGAGRIAPESLVSFGKPFQEIARVAKEREADLIVLATHGYTGFKHIQLGSTAERVVRHAPCPVLVVRAETQSKRDQAVSGKTKPVASPFKVQNILVPIDFSPRSGKVLEYALPIARRFNAKIVLLHVVHADYFVASSDYSVFDYPELMQELRRAGEKQLGDLARSIRKKCPVTTVVQTGHPGNLIVETADKLGIGLIIIATHGHTGFKRAFLGSTAEFVVRHAHCPVLAMRERQPLSW
jgi:nucleotide-binding universal stress UspA family protein